MPQGSPAPALWWAVERDGWVLSAFDDIEGRHPSLAPGSADLPAVLDAVAALGETLTPCPYEAARSAAAELGPLFGGWATLAADPPADLDDWSLRHLDALAAHESSCLDAMDGDTLLHTDLREDNLMIDTRSGRVLVIDWAWPARGAAWVDIAFLVPQFIRAGHHPAGAEALLAEVAGWKQAAPEAVTSYAVALSGLWERDSRTTTSAGLRAYRAAAAAAGRRWVAHRTGWR
ncbi:aminoglycoside phosphotransferase family protein [Umezawaea endophytica]|uniref:Aminoglycoside phosphotransferase family protein n=1 Tax=Umezawaea endophytica TaxID=1654476 RepID=A0A9X2VWM2_9PSEU|nr:aminoglycoside phosphotransferase family protein [Umezawaea endophytica]MCS7483732.1 aminoglycoside phosphotransferase family protein [Umezawaea endophytica]